MASRLYQGTSNSRKDSEWSGYVEVLKARFGDELFGDAILELKNLHQEGSFADYQRNLDGFLHSVQLIERVLEMATIC